MIRKKALLLAGVAVLCALLLGPAVANCAEAGRTVIDLNVQPGTGGDDALPATSNWETSGLDGTAFGLTIWVPIYLPPMFDWRNVDRSIFLPKLRVIHPNSQPITPKMR